MNVPKHLITFLLLVFCIVSNAQTDTLKTNKRSLNKGFYLTYQEFINNSPSIKYDFNVIEFPETPSDSLGIDVKFILNDATKKIHDIWGFSDGNAVYVSYPIASSIKHYWKLNNTGIIPFFYFRNTDNPSLSLSLRIFNVPIPMPVKIIKSAPEDKSISYEFKIITEKGKIKEPTVAFLKNKLKRNPELLKSFEESYAPYKKYESLDYGGVIPQEMYPEVLDIIISYIIKLNEATSK